MATSPTPSRRILVTGATGNQGSAVIDALVLSPSLSSFEIVALTRNTSSPKAKSISAKSPSIKLLQGDLDDCSTLFESCPGPVDSVYSVQTNAFGSEAAAKQEEQQAYNLIDAAIAHGVKHFVQASGDRGGPEASEANSTDVPHFATKFNIEKYLRQHATANMTWTILRPVTFMENNTPDFTGKAFATMWAKLGDKRLQLVSTKDIGVIAAKALQEPESPTFKNKAISLAGDELTQAQASKVFEEIFAYPMPTTYGLVGNLVQWQVPELKAMFDWFGKAGFKADVAQCRSIHPGMQDFGTWLKEGSRFKKPECWRERRAAEKS